jgi:hypothetical protein
MLYHSFSVRIANDVQCVIKYFILQPTILNSNLHSKSNFKIQNLRFMFLLIQLLNKFSASTVPDSSHLWEPLDHIVRQMHLIHYFTDQFYK